MCAAWILGFDVESATIVINTDQGYQGQTVCPVRDKLPDEVTEDWDRYLYKNLLVIYSGPAASRIYKPDTESPTSWYYGDRLYTADDRAADELIEEMDPLERRAISMRASDEAESLTKDHWECVKYVASVLLERKTLDQAQCQDVLKEAFHYRR